MRSESFLYSHKTNKAAVRLLCFPREPGSETETSLDTFHQKFELIRQIIKFAPSLLCRDSAELPRSQHSATGCLGLGRGESKRNVKTKKCKFEFEWIS